MAPLKVVALGLVPLVDGMVECPSSKSFVHAGCSITYKVKGGDCKIVREEVLARIAKKNGWQDPHNRGEYTLEADQEVLSVSRKAPNGGFIDKINLAFKDLTSGFSAGAMCQVEACSSSQGFSILDFSTNYCNSLNLLCGASNSCGKAVHDIDVVEQDAESCWQKDETKCNTISHPAIPAMPILAQKMLNSQNSFMSKLRTILTTSKVSTKPQYTKSDTHYVCPGSDAWVHHAKCTAQFLVKAEKCESVKDEINNRLQGKNGWFDMHNRGVYALVNYNAKENIFAISRTTRNWPNYLDQLILQLVEQKEGGCRVFGCSESQVTSYVDFSTNYCNLKMLLCGSKDGCKVSEKDFVIEETYDDCKYNDASQCLAVQAQQPVPVPEVAAPIEEEVIHV